MTNWIPIVGKFEISNNTLLFEGGTTEPNSDGKKLSNVGLVLSNQKFSGGKISAQVIFFPSEDRSQFDIVFYYDTQSSAYLSAGIGYNKGPLFIIQYFDGKKYEQFTAGGDASNIKPNTTYDVGVSLVGSKASLFLNGVNICTADVKGNVPRTQVGFFCLGARNIKVENYKIYEEESSAFVIMEFSPPFNEIHNDIIKPICKEFQILVERADDKCGPGLIISDIQKKIIESKFLIAEISSNNPNVFYEVGYAHAINKPVILLSEIGRSLPFDVSGFRVLHYENTMVGRTKMVEELRKHIKEILSAWYGIDISHKPTKALSERDLQHKD